MYKTLLVTLTASALSIGAVASAHAVRKEQLDAATLSAIKSKFGRLMELANNHDFKALHGMFWQSPSTLLVAKSAIPSEGNWAGFWATRQLIKSCMTSVAPVRSCSSQIIRSSRSSA